MENSSTSGAPAPRALFSADCREGEWLENRPRATRAAIASAARATQMRIEDGIGRAGRALSRALPGGETVSEGAGLSGRTRTLTRPDHEPGELPAAVHLSPEPPQDRAPDGLHLGGRV